MTIQFERIGQALGARVTGIDLAQPLTPTDHQALHQGLLEHQVLFFRDQLLTPAQQRNAAALFGDLHIHPIYPKIAEQPEILVLDTDLNDLRDNALWHSDVSFIQSPPLGSLLSARHVPPHGGDTLWASCSAAYDALSAPIRGLLDGLTAVHDLTLSFPLERFGNTPDALEKWNAARAANPPVTHPVVRVHPETGRKGLFVSEAFTSRIVELEPDESTALLQMLFKQIARPEFAVRWQWRQGDLAFWDNRLTQHYACDDYRPQRRIMHRATILGDRPFGP
ncbi:taurine dioxygenase [Pseudomonas sp. URMO17WK12:I4]|uniref:taurine dioxygenase n=1 Tax=Pseudomonas sp. URMO17WK12:I4 TaxID=1283292 RepID=UPI0004806CCD|nr:taurine dioxygenase [Pseudomonas sp. URMO17WK12:I4]